MYSERLRSLFHSREHAGALPGATHFGEGGERGRGPYIQLWVRCTVEERIQEARFKTYGCPAAIACAEAACRLGEGRTLAQVRAVTSAQIAEEAGGVPESKEHCPELAALALLGLRALD